MSDLANQLATIDAAASGLIQALTERLERHGLGEIEIRRGDLRVRVAAAVRAAPAAAEAHAAARPSPAGTEAHAGATPHGGHPPTGLTPLAVTSPAVGYFAYIDGLGPGLTVEKGDPLGFVDVLGVRHDVRAPRSGKVHSLVSEAGEAVEYGQLLIELEAPGT